jgi:predicted ATPase with chaperone activity
MLAKVTSVGALGIEAYLIEVECSVARGLQAVAIVGLPDAAVKESVERVQAAVGNCHYRWPRGRVTVNLVPADTRKEGSAYDLPVADEQILPVPVGELAMERTRLSLLNAGGLAEVMKVDHVHNETVLAFLRAHEDIPAVQSFLRLQHRAIVAMNRGVRSDEKDYFAYLGANIADEAAYATAELEALSGPTFGVWVDE